MSTRHLIPSTAADLESLTVARCEICGDPFEIGERVIDDPESETTHAACVSAWFDGHFGAEGLDTRTITFTSDGTPRLEAR